MTQPIELPAPPNGGKTEWKVKVATIATYLAGVAASVFLSTTVTDYVQALPDVAENIVYPALLAAITLLAGRQAKTRPDALSDSTVAAVETWLRKHAPRRGGTV